MVSTRSTTRAELVVKGERFRLRLLQLGKITPAHYVAWLFPPLPSKNHYSRLETVRIISPAQILLCVDVEGRRKCDFASCLHDPAIDCFECRLLPGELEAMRDTTLGREALLRRNARAGCGIWAADPYINGKGPLPPPPGPPPTAPALDAPRPKAPHPAAPHPNTPLVIPKAENVSLPAPPRPAPEAPLLPKAENESLPAPPRPAPEAQLLVPKPENESLPAPPRPAPEAPLLVPKAEIR